MAVVLQNQNGGRPLDQVLGKTNPFRKGALLIDQGGDQLIGVDLSPAHGIEMAAAEGQVLLQQGLRVVDDADGADGVGAQVGPDQQRLGVRIGNAADGAGALHLVQNAVEFGTEGRIFNIVNFPLETQLGIVGCHAAPAGTQVGMVVRAEEYVQNAVPLGDRAKETAHGIPPFIRSALAAELHLFQGPSLRPLPAFRPASGQGPHRKPPKSGQPAGLHWRRR